MMQNRKRYLLVNSLLERNGCWSRARQRTRSSWQPRQRANGPSFSTRSKLKPFGNYLNGAKAFVIPLVLLPWITLFGTITRTITALTFFPIFRFIDAMKLFVLPASISLVPRENYLLRVVVSYPLDVSPLCLNRAHATDWPLGLNI